VFNDSQTIDPGTLELMIREMERGYPQIAEMLGAVYHHEASVVGQGCDDQFEFEFALDMLLDGLDKQRHRLPGLNESL
jgi:hypothetical protein